MTKPREKTREKLTDNNTLGTLCPKVISARHPCAPIFADWLMDRLYSLKYSLQDFITG